MQGQIGSDTELSNPLDNHCCSYQYDIDLYIHSSHCTFTLGQSYTAGYPPTENIDFCPNVRILVDIVSHTSEARLSIGALRYYFQGIAGPVNNVTIHGNCAVVTFSNPISKFKFNT